MSYPGESVYFAPKEIKMPPEVPLINLVKRDEWGALPPKCVVPLETPVSHIRFTYTATPCTTSKAENIEWLKKLQTKHMEKDGLPDIQYNFLIGGDGTVFEGRGWEADSWKPTEHEDLHGKSIDVAYMGEFANSEPNWDMSVASQRFLRFGEKMKYIEKPFKVTGMRE